MSKPQRLEFTWIGKGTGYGLYCSSGSRFVETVQERHMAEPMITCPKCQTGIKLTESLAAPIIESAIKKRKP